jgi:hypothetical protein
VLLPQPHEKDLDRIRCNVTELYGSDARMVEQLGEIWSMGFEHAAEHLEGVFFGCCVEFVADIIHGDNLDASGCELKPGGNQYSSDLHRAGARPIADHFVVVHGAGVVGDAVVCCGVEGRYSEKE